MSQPEQILDFYFVESKKRQRGQGSGMKEASTDGKNYMREIDWIYKTKRKDYGIKVSQVGKEAILAL